jgi:hypothetical protein
VKACISALGKLPIEQPSNHSRDGDPEPEYRGLFRHFAARQKRENWVKEQAKEANNQCNPHTSKRELYDPFDNGGWPYLCE